jgi:hypothetical protein
MTARSILFTSLITLAMAGCVSAGTSSKNAQPNSGGDAAPSKLSEPGSENQPPVSSHTPAEFSQPPQAETIESPRQPEQAPEQTAQSNALEHRAAAAPVLPQTGSTVSGSRAAMASNDQAIASEPRRARIEAKAPAAMQRPVERPGLATLWGETRESRVTTVSFNRSGNAPWSLLRIQYDDEAGILSRTGLSNVSALGSNLVETPNGFLSVQVVDGAGSPLAGLTEGSKSFVVGHTGERYSIQITNHSNERFEVVATVDGLDVLDGRPGSFAKRGYLIDANSSLDIDGFRRNTSAVAAFRFGSVKDSYAARTSGDHNVGVIGIAVFREYHRNYNNRIDENRRRDDADPFPNRFAVPPAPPAPIIRD